MIASIGLPGTIIFGEIPAESLYGMILWPMHTASGSLLIIAGVSYAVVSLFALTSCLSMVMFYLFVLACIKKELKLYALATRSFHTEILQESHQI
jgi:hypothetical protein